MLRKNKIRLVIKLGISLTLIIFIISATQGCKNKAGSSGKIESPLKVSALNPRYFADESGKIVYLTGSHTWSNLVDIGTADPPVPFDFINYLTWMQKYNHNFIRLWAWELLKWNSKNYNPDSTYTVYPHPWKRTGPGNAADGKLKFDLGEFDPEYFDRLRSRVDSAYERGIYVSIMLFEGWGLQFATDAWQYHPFRKENNINGIDGDADGDGNGLEIYRLTIPEITTVQENYVRKVIDAVNDLDNVLYEISNENHPPSTDWQYHFINFIHDYESTKSKQHPVGMTFQYKGGSNQTLLDSPAEWISPNPFVGDKDMRNDPPPADGKKVILYDTDHLWGIGGNYPWVWKTFLRGMNPLFMDPYNGVFIGNSDDPKWEPIRQNMGYARKYAEKINLLKAVPHIELSSTTYCLADPGSEYIIYQPVPDSSFGIIPIKGEYFYEWFNPVSGLIENSGKVNIDKENFIFKSPFKGDAVLYLKTVK